ncbi:MAG: hypothetical protein ACTSX2_01320 [Candidatus Thorarchaeota archaeon]
MGTIVTERYLKWQKHELNAEQIKTNNPFEVMVRLNAKDVVQGTYKFHWYCEVKNNPPSNASIVVRAKAKTNIVGTHEFEDPSVEWHHFAGWDFIQLGNREQPVVELEWRRPSGNSDIVCRNARVSIEFMEGQPSPGGIQRLADQGAEASARGRSMR